MSTSLTFAELTNIAIPKCGVVNFGALHLVLQGILEHIHLSELKKDLSGNENLLQTSGMPVPKKDVQLILPSMSQLGVSDPVLSRIDKIESQLSILRDLPSTVQLLEGSTAARRPMEDLWNFIKLYKKMEGNEDAIGKVTQTVQDLLIELHLFKITVDSLKKDVDTLRDIFEKIHPEKIDVVTEDLRMQTRRMNALQREVVTIQTKIQNIPKSEEVVLWSSLHEAMFTGALALPGSKQTSEKLPEATVSQTQNLEDGIQRPTSLQKTPEHDGKKVQSAHVRAAPASGVQKTAVPPPEPWPAPELAIPSIELGPGPAPATGPRPAPGTGPRPAPGPGPGPAPGTGPGPTPGIGPRPTPGTGPGPAPGTRPGPGSEPGLGPRPAPGIEPGPEPGPWPWPGPWSWPGPAPAPFETGPGPWPRPAPAPAPGTGPGPGPGPGPGFGPGSGPVPWPGPAPAPAPGTGAGPGPWPGPAPGIGTGSGPWPGPGAGPGPGPWPWPGPVPAPAPGTGPGAVPGTGPGPGPGPWPGPGPAPGTGTGSGPWPGPGPAPGTGTGSGPWPWPGPAPGTGPGTGPGLTPGMGPGTRPGLAPGTGPGTKPGLAPGTGPRTRPGLVPGTGPTTRSGPVPRTGPGPAPGTGPGPTPGTGPWPGPAPGTGPGPAPGTGPWPGPAPGTGPGPTPETGHSPWPGPAPGTEPGPGPGPAPETGPGPRPGPAPAPGTGLKADAVLALEPGTTPDLVPAFGLGPGPVLDGWPFLDFPTPGLSGPLQPLPSQLFSAIPPFREIGYSWPGQLQPHQSHRAVRLHLPGVKEMEDEHSHPSRKEISQEKTPRRGAQQDAASEALLKHPGSSVKRAKITATVAAATAAAYAAAASTAARAAQAATKAIKEASASKMATTTLSEPLKDSNPSTVSSHGAALSQVVSEEEEEEVEDVQPYVCRFSPAHPSSILPKTTLSQGMMLASQAESPEEKKKAVQYSMSHIAQVPITQDTLKTEFSKLSTNLERRLTYLGKLKDVSRFGATLESLQEKFDSLQKSRLQQEELERIWRTQIEATKNQYMVLDRAIGRLHNRLEDFKSLQTQIDRLKQEKVNKSTLEKDLKEKAEKSALASKANRHELDMLATEMNKMVQSVLFKITTYEEDWEKALKQLKKDLATKLVSNDLEAIKKDIEEIWRVVLKLVIDSLQYDPDRAAGFRKKLFERVKCISCDRPVKMMSSPQLITIHKGLLSSRLRPASANGYEYLEQGLLREQKLQLQQMDPLDTQQDWGDGPRNTTTKQRTYNMTTLYPYGDPEELNYDTAEVDILGVDGILYKGRMTSQTGTQPPAVEKDLTAVKIPLGPLPAQTLSDRLRSSASIGAAHPSPGLPGFRTGDSSVTSRHVSTLSRPSSLLPLLPLVIPPRGDSQQLPGPPRQQRFVHPEPRLSTVSAEESANLNTTVSK